MDIFAQIDDALIAVEAIARMGAQIEHTPENAPTFDEFDEEIAAARQKLQEAKDAADAGDMMTAELKINEALEHLKRAVELLKQLRS